MVLIVIHDAAGLSRDWLFLKRWIRQGFIDHSCWECRPAEGCQAAWTGTVQRGGGLWIRPTFNLTPVLLCACSFAEWQLDTKRHKVCVSTKV